MTAVSVIIPTYKHAKYVLETIGSVFAQSFRDYEIIVINDGSPDDTAAVLRPLAESGRIRYIEQENAGQAAARNRGLAEATGEYVAFLDDDDLWPADKLEWQVTALEGRPKAIMAYGFTELFGEGAGDPFPGPDAPDGSVYERFLAQNWLWSPGQTLMRAAAVREISGFDTKIWGADDWDLYIRLSQRGLFRYEHRCALRYRFHDANASRKVGRMYANITKVRRKHLGYFPMPWNFRLWWKSWNNWSRSFATAFWAQAERMEAAGDMAGASEAWRGVVRARPHWLARRAVTRAMLRSFQK
jgi:glycosyltransferase involved in cell wall biosynthesis